MYATMSGWWTVSCHKSSFLASQRRGAAQTCRRERKKARTRQVIADAAARLFAQRGYEQVTVSDVAREAEVSEQTVYNYFQTKEQLVTDRDQLIQDQLSRLIRTRAPEPHRPQPSANSCSTPWRGSAASPPTSGAASSASWPPSAPPSTGSPWSCQTARPPHPRGPKPEPDRRRAAAAIEAVLDDLDAWLTSATDQHDRNRAT